MSCDSKRRKFLRGLAPSMPDWAQATGLGDASRCSRWLERVYQVAANRGRNWEGMHPPAQRSQQENTTLSYVSDAAAEMRGELEQTGLKLHNHGDNGASGADWGYAQLRWTLGAMANRQNLPPIAAEAYMDELNEFIAANQPLEGFPKTEEPKIQEAVAGSRHNQSTPALTFTEVVTPNGASLTPAQLDNCGRCGRFYNTLDPASHLCPDIAEEVGLEDELEEAVVVGADGFAYPLALCDRCERCGGLYLEDEAHQCAGEQLALPLDTVDPVQTKPQAPRLNPTTAKATGPEGTVYYFAFGSNMNPQRLKSRRVPFTRRLPGQIKGWRLAFNKKGGADGVGFANVMASEDNDAVEGLLYEMPRDAIEELAHFEGYPQHYGLQPALVDLGEGRAAPALMFVAQPWQVEDNLKPTRDYLDHLLGGKDLISSGYHDKLAAQEVAPPAPRPPAPTWGKAANGAETKPGVTNTPMAKNSAKKGASSAGSRTGANTKSYSYGSRTSHTHSSGSLSMAPAERRLDWALAHAADKDPASRWEALRVVEQATSARRNVAPDRAIVEQFVPAAADSDWSVRAPAQRLFDRITQSPGVIALIRKQYDQPDPRLRLAAVAALRNVKTRREAQSLIVAALGDPDDEVAAMAEYVFWRPLAGDDHPRISPPGWLARQAELARADKRLDYAQSRPFFVYGTLRHGQSNYQRLLRGETVAERPARLENAGMYSTGIAFVVDAPFDLVVGDLMWVADHDFAEVCKRLDRLEGFNPDQPNSGWGYKRVTREVMAHDADGRPYVTRAWVYQGVGRSPGWNAATFRRSGDWLNQEDSSARRSSWTEQ